MKKLSILTIVLVLIMAGAYAISYKVDQGRKQDLATSTASAGFASSTAESGMGQNQQTGTGKPAFAWSYESSEKEEIPWTKISLTAAYENGIRKTKEVDAVQGSCNAYVSPDKDVYSGSEMIICYYAGLGHYYKVVEAEGGYSVRRKIFEEASPEYDPPVFPFAEITRF